MSIWPGPESWEKKVEFYETMMHIGTYGIFGLAILNLTNVIPERRRAIMLVPVAGFTFMGLYGIERHSYYTDLALEKEADERWSLHSNRHHWWDKIP